MIKEHLQYRNLDTNLYNQSVVIDTDNNVCTFLLSDFNDKLTGYQQYNPIGEKLLRCNQADSKYFTHVTKDMLGVFGLEYVSDINIMFIVEGVFKACRFHNMGYNSIAVLTNNPIKHIDKFNQLSNRYTTVVIPDPDKAGMKLTKYGTHFVIPDKSVDEMSDEEVLRLIIRALKVIAANSSGVKGV